MKNEILVEDLLKKYSSYVEGVRAVEQMTAEGKIIPIKNSGSNGKHPPLYRKYRKPVLKKKSNEEAFEEFIRILPPDMKPDHYVRYRAQFEKAWPAIKRFIEVLESDPDFSQPASENERSFQIWGKEKFLCGSGKRILENLNYPLEELNVYETHEPMTYFAARSEPSFILINENLDPFVNCRRILSIDQKQGILIYGDGKKIIRNLADLEETDAGYLQGSLDRIYYLGDLDYEGILIYESLCRKYPNLTIRLCTDGYLKMLDKAEQARIDLMPFTKDGQYEQEGSLFFSQFLEDQVQRMKTILEAKRYIPQEILLRDDYEEIMEKL